MTPALPDAVRSRVVGFAAEVLPAVPAHELPGSLRQFASFAPARRAKLAAAALLAAVENEAAFRTRVSEAASASLAELAAAIDTGQVPADAAAADVAALAYLRRPEGWEALLRVAAEQLAEAAMQAGVTAEAGSAARLAVELENAKAAGRAASEKLRAELETVKREAASLRGQLKAAQEAARRSDQEAAKLRTALQQAETAVAAAADRADKADRRDRARRSELEAELATLKREARAARTYDDVRLRVLLDSLVGAAGGLRRELDLPATTGSPADRVSPDVAVEAAAGPSASRRGADDTQWLDALLVVPGAHLVVDGYNVTKTGYGELPLEAQRTRLLAGLAGLASRTGAEVTCVFDGSEVSAAVTQPAARGVRVRWPDHSWVRSSSRLKVTTSGPPSS